MKMSPWAIPWKYCVKCAFERRNSSRRQKHVEEKRSMRRGIHHRARQAAKRDIRQQLEEL